MYIFKLIFYMIFKKYKNNLDILARRICQALKITINNMCPMCGSFSLFAFYILYFSIDVE